MEDNTLLFFQPSIQQSDCILQSQTHCMEPSRVEFIGNEEDPTKLFCSEFVANVLENSKVIGSIEEARTTLIELCRLEGVYAESVWFKGSERQEIRRHDTPDGV